MLWDIFCKVIDNHGDLGVCWRLASQLAARGERIRLRVDDARALAWMAPEGQPGVQVLPWPELPPAEEPAAVVIEAFGCELPAWFQSSMAQGSRALGRQPVWINLEYLTAEPFAERNHGLPSPVLAGPAAGLTKYFFYPGFTPGTGGLLRESDLPQSQAGFDRARWLHRHGVQASSDDCVASLFCYEPPVLDQLLSRCASGRYRTHLLVTAGRASAAVREALDRKNRQEPGWDRPARLSLVWLPLLSQVEFDHLLWACDINFVRGEDSLVRALWAGKPLVWQIYPQDDEAHHRKLNAFLNLLDAPPALRELHHAWNGVGGAWPHAWTREWQACVERGRARLLAQEDLATQLMRFVACRLEAGAKPAGAATGRSNQETR